MQQQWSRIDILVCYRPAMSLVVVLQTAFLAASTAMEYSNSGEIQSLWLSICTTNKCQRSVLKNLKSKEWTSKDERFLCQKAGQNMSFALFWLLNNILVDEKCSRYICRDVKMINTAFENSRYCLDRKSVCCSLFLTCQTGPACFVNIRSAVAVKIVLWDAKNTWKSFGVF